ncbi:IS66 family insertion sequence element accessory protein TnpB [Mesorhizobium sp. M0244]|uniref:IS66 family insertion sequence element accessory protein TnpB n=1 Tax=Mesorhizobium sp. M0244 TaxID=2956926 RepID=UPI0033387B1C
MKLLYFDGQGFCLYCKTLQKGRFAWPSAADGTARLTSAQMAMLWEGIDWRRPTTAENLPDDPALLKAMIAALRAENARMSGTLQVHDQLILSLRLRIARAGAAPPGAVYYFAPNWKEDHVHRHLYASGILQADGYKGYDKLYEPGADGSVRFREAAWRRDFHDIWTSNKSGSRSRLSTAYRCAFRHRARHCSQPANVRLAARQRHSQAKVEAFRVWIEAHLTRIPARAIWRKPSGMA